MKPWSYIWLEFRLFSTIIAIIRACACWALFVVTLTNTVHLIYITPMCKWYISCQPVWLLQQASHFIIAMILSLQWFYKCCCIFEWLTMLSFHFCRCSAETIYVVFFVHLIWWLSASSGGIFCLGREFPVVHGSSAWRSRLGAMGLTGTDVWNFLWSVSMSIWAKLFNIAGIL